MYIRYCYLVIFALFLAACGNNEIETNMSENVADFEFTTQDNEKLGLDELKGEWWIADFIFTNCVTVCLPMTSNMSQLQDLLQEEGMDVQLISFTVDPENDTPEVLKKYADSNGAELENWNFLTGFNYETIKDLSEGSFRSELHENPGSDQLTHGIRFFLVTPEGEVIKNYYGMDMKEVETIIDDLKKVL
ncbi:SCO1 protein [Oceanobacillus oncorhynchi subsp. incaldanensis]|uniref:SCO family protein n=1 Tax=Oceanobacillus oncorhynchi TaxID=545501 RepID=UPI001B24A27F|nr:SCO family protein [Oceanobacillus oncorhynchi]GIO19344.1 SCO1 protein [Oceanobacillus oncorhynchi subsp. incaldanensis]